MSLSFPPGFANPRSLRQSLSNLLAHLERKRVLSYFCGMYVLAGFLLGLGILFAMGATMLAISILLHALMKRQIERIDIRRAAPAGGFENGTATIRLTIVNRGRWPVFRMTVIDTFTADESPETRIPLPAILHANTRREFRYDAFIFRHRGEYRAGPAMLVLEDPFGVFTMRRKIAESRPFYVYPEVTALPRLPLEARSLLRDTAMQSLALPGWNQEFLGARDYRPGDPARHIHWPQSARRDTLVVREFERDVAAEAWIFLDLLQGGRAGLGRESIQEYAVRAAASIAAHALERGVPTGLAAAGPDLQVLPPRRGDAQLHEILEALIPVRQTGSIPIDRLVESQIVAMPPRALAILIISASNFDTPRLERMLDLLAARRAGVLAILIDAAGFTNIDFSEHEKREWLTVEEIAFALAGAGATAYVIRKDQPLNVAMAQPVSDPRLGSRQ